MKRMFASALVLGVALVAGVSQAADEKAQTITGTLVDTKCGGDKNEEGVAKHPAACALKCADGGSPLVVKSGTKTYKLDEKGQTLAKEYLGKKENKTKVQVMGTVKEDTITVTSLKAAEEKKG